MTSALSRAKTLLRMNQSETMTGYTPQGKDYFVRANAWSKKPRKGDVIYFYSAAKGRVGHTGIVESVDERNKIVKTIEGNTTSYTYAENGGCVARHTYDYTRIGGTNRVNGFGRPNFSKAGITADQFVAKAVAEIGYLEKKTRSNLDSKSANAGANNFQKYQRDVGAGNGDQWCQYFVDAIALYACQGHHGTASSTASKSPSTKSTPTKLTEQVSWYGTVTASSLNVRKWAGTEHDTVSFSPLNTGTKVGVCAAINADDGTKWYYIKYDKKYGFVSAKYIERL